MYINGEVAEWWAPLNDDPEAYTGTESQEGFQGWIYVVI